MVEEVQIGISALFRSAEAIAMLDMLASYADVAAKFNYGKFLSQSLFLFDKLGLN